MYEASALPNSRARAIYGCNTSGGARLFRALILSHDAYDDALHLYAVRFHHDRLHRGVGGLQPHAPVLAIELLQCDVRAANQGNHHLAVVSGFAVFDDDEITVTDL